MPSLRRAMDRIAPAFKRGGRLARFGAVYEMFDTFLYTPADVTRGPPHVRDGIDLKRLMIYVVLALIPCLLVGLWNTGYQTNVAVERYTMNSMPHWHAVVLGLLDAGHDPASAYDNIVHGFIYFLPIYVVTMVVGLGWEVLFALVRNHEVNEGFLVTAMLFPLILPASIPLWQVALAISFGVVVAKEIFGGTGKNFVNPALAARAFLFFAYPAQISGDTVWTPVDGFSGATALARAEQGGVHAVVANGTSWLQAFLGQMQGDIGATSTLACLLGGAFLIVTGIASWRIVVSVFLGMVATASIFNAVGSDTNPMFDMPWYWHLVLGGSAFGMMFMATDPVTACMTNVGRYVFGGLIGVLTVVLRVQNAGYPEGVMLAILLANIFAPLIDYCVIKAHIARRRRRLRRVAA